MDIIEGSIVASDARVAIAVGRFNNFINNSLLTGALDALRRMGQINDNNISVVWVPGAYELPLTVSLLAKNRQHDAIIALGCVIRGATPHFDYVAGECSAGLAKVSIDTDLPVIFGVLTTDSIEQAIERAGSKAGNKGFEAAMTALEMINVIRAMKATFN